MIVRLSKVATLCGRNYTLANKCSIRTISTNFEFLQSEFNLGPI